LKRIIIYHPCRNRQILTLLTLVASFWSSDDTLRNINLEHSGSENSLSQDTEVFDLGHVLLTPNKHAETVYVDIALRASTIPISAPTSQLIHSALCAPLPSDELSAASINSSTDLSDSDSDSNSDMADNNPPSFGGTTAKDAENWLRHFCNYCDFKSHSSAKILALFKVLMTGSAAIWLNSLSAI